MRSTESVEYVSVNDAHDDEDRGTDILNLIEQLQAIAGKIRQEGADLSTSRCRCDSDGDIEITYERPESAAERTDRLNREEAEQRRIRDRLHSERNSKLLQLRSLAQELNVHVDFTKGRK